ncbi:MAG: hypothetical protein JST55_04450 [Bacteroidetes bacterium]|nr:hypothetical protein [Bacteroidota bacterium]
MALRKPLKNITELKTHAGIKIPVSEYNAFKKIVLLNELKYLYDKKSPKSASRLEKIKPINISELKKLCPDYLKFIFKIEPKKINFELISSHHEEYYNFILRYNIKEYPIDKFEQYYFSILDLLNDSIDKLVGHRISNNYYVKHNIELGWGDPDEIELKHDVKNTPTNDSGKSKNPFEFLPEILTPKIVWSDTIELLIKLFNEFRKINYVLYDDDEQLLQHFFVKDSKIKASVENLNMDRSSVAPLVWNHNFNSLALFFDTLRNEKKIEFNDDNGYYVLVAEHFVDKYKKEMTNKQIGDASGRNASNKRKRWFINFSSKLCQILDIQSS